MRIAAVSGPDPGHLLPVAAVADALAERGADVTVVTTPRWQDDIEGGGMRFAELPRAAHDPRDDDIGWRLWGKAAEMAPDLRDLLRELDVDAVVTDTLTSAGGFAADLVGVPWAEVVPHWLWAPSPALPPIGLGMAPPRTPLGRLHAAHLRRQQAASFAAGDQQRAEARRSLGLPADRRPDCRLLATLPALELPRPDWPAATYVAGALAWEPASWGDLAPPPGDDPLVLVSDSTASNVGEALAPRTVSGLADAPVRIVATSKAPVDERPGVVNGRGRHGPLLDVASCVVAFGGHGLVSKALSRGVPMVLVPLQGDQRETAMRAALVGAAIALPLEQATPRRVGEAVRTVLEDPSYRAAARRVAESAAGLGPQRAAELVERHLS